MADKNNNTIELTQQGYDELQQELEELEKVELPKIIERVANAREQGDLSENADYQSAKDEQSMAETRISEIKDILQRAKIIKKTRSHQKIGVGSQITVYLKGKAKKSFDYEIVGEFEGDPAEGKISSVSPLGKALMGKKKGDEAKVAAPAGEIVYVIEKIK
ncbi:MAG: transcription elongation factor GreA [Candidatus Pacebacteria bacterium]|nr:transcription elongation factor GreA [Candidatus Paceibacterota bacterium]